MLIYLFYALNLLLLLSCLLVFRLERGDRLFSLSLVQALLGLPLLAGEYIYLAYHMESRVVPLLLFSESAFAFIWFYMAYRMGRVTDATAYESRRSLFIQIFIGAALIVLAGYGLVYPPEIEMLDNSLVFNLYGPVYFSAIFLLISILVMAWRLEKFWRLQEPAHRWGYKFLVVGSFMVCGILGWTSSYRLTYLRLLPDHFWLLAVLLFLAWSFMGYAVARYRLLNRKVFISRKIVYSFVAPSIFAVYLLTLGLVSLVMRIFGLPLPFVLRWLFLALGLVALGLFAFSKKLRRRVHFFISTHFYVNKYEYRDEWLALSQLFQGAVTETDIVGALGQVLAESLYTTNHIIWLGDAGHGYRTASSHGNPNGMVVAGALAPDDPLVQFLQTHSYFYLKNREPDDAWKAVAEKKEGFLADHNLVLMAPLATGDQLLGLIGLGPEFTGGRYGLDDFDLLTALGTQTASALLAVRMADKLALARERQAWDKLSAFVLHDVKNAATMLSLALENAPDNLQNPEFQQDMLGAAEDALRRMARVQERLSELRRESTPAGQDLELGRFLQNECRLLEKKLGSIKIALDCHTGIQAHTDPALLSRILENLLLNALESGGDGTEVRITVSNDEDQGQTVIEITDNGPGILEDLLPNELFEPFKTTKPQGTGIGLWQVERLVTSLKGSIAAENAAESGARFVVRLPPGGVGKFNSG